MATKRMLQLAEQIRDCIAVMIAQGQIRDPRVQHVTIHAVNMSPDLQLAKVYFVHAAREGAPSLEDTLKGLKQASGFMRKELSKQLQLRFLPDLAFYYDDSLDYSLKMRSLLDEVSKERELHPPEVEEGEHKEDAPSPPKA